MDPTFSARSARRRRTLLGSIDPNQFQSGIPQSAKRRPSMGRAANENTGIHGAVISRPSKATSHVRLSSMPNSVFMKDPRPLRDKHWQQETIRYIMDYLAAWNYPHGISIKNLQQPTTKDFQNVFKFLYGKIDGNGWNLNKKFEEEVPGILKSLRYPFVGEISKSSLYAIGSMHTWPQYLGMLRWLVELAILADTVAKIEDYDQVPLEDATPEHIYFNYVVQAYSDFLAGADDFGDLQKELNELFEKKNANILEKTKAVREEIEQLEAELLALERKEPPLAGPKKENSTLQADKQKFIMYIEHLEQRKKKVTESIEKSERDLKISDEELKKLRAKRTKTQEMVDSQPVSHNDLERMHQEREILQSGLDDISLKIKQVSAEVNENEILLEKNTETTTTLIQKFNNRATCIGIIPRSAQYAKGEDYEIRLNKNVEKLEDMTNINITNAIVPLLSDLRNELNKEYNELQTKQADLDHEIQKQKDAIATKQSGLEEISRQINDLNIAYEEEKTAMDQEAETSAEYLSTTAAKLKHLKIHGAKSLTETQQEYQQIQIECDRMELEYNSKIELANKLCAAIEENQLKMRQQISEGLGSFKAMTEAELYSASNK